MRAGFVSVGVATAMFLTFGAASQETCKKIRMTEVMQGYAEASFGPSCVQDFSVLKQICVPDGREIISMGAEIIGQNNVITIGPTVTQSSSSCISASMSVRTHNHIGQYPLYQCTPGQAAARVWAEYCQ